MRVRVCCFWIAAAPLAPRDDGANRSARFCFVQFDVGLAALTGKMLGSRCAWLMCGGFPSSKFENHAVEGWDNLGGKHRRDLIVVDVDMQMREHR
jgi:hypothetical protein